MVLTNPPFGKKSSTTIIGADGKPYKEKETIEREDFWATTSNKQLNFVQHVKTLLKQHGRAAIVVPDNVLFEGGAGETVRRKLLHECDVHTLLRLPTGLFFTLKTNPLKREDLDEFVRCYNPENRHKRKATWTEAKPNGRWRSFDYEDLINRDKASLDIFWLKDESLADADNLPDPGIIAREIVDDLEAALEQFKLIAEDLGENQE
jgi:type I restriction enzyme M protein